MAEDTLRRQYFEIIMRQVSGGQFPSPPMLDRLEEAVGDYETAQIYVRSLIEKLAAERFPSPTMLDRITGLIDMLEPQGAAG